MTIPSSGVPLGPIATAAEAVLTKFGYPFHTNRRGTSILFESRTDGGASWRSRLAIYEDSRVLEFTAFVTDDPTNPNRRAWVLELSCRANAEFRTGAFVFDWDEGWVQFRCTVRFDDRQATESEIESLLNAAAYPLKVWQHSFRLRHNHVTPRAALDSALLKTDAFEGEVTKETRKALLSLV